VIVNIPAQRKGYGLGVKGKEKVPGRGESSSAPKGAGGTPAERVILLNIIDQDFANKGKNGKNKGVIQHKGVVANGKGGKRALLWGKLDNYLLNM